MYTIYKYIFKQQTQQDIENQLNISFHTKLEIRRLLLDHVRPM